MTAATSAGSRSLRRAEALIAPSYSSGYTVRSYQPGACTPPEPDDTRRTTPARPATTARARPNSRRRLTAKLTDSEFERRMAQQMPEDEKIARSDFVFHNSGERKALREFVGQTVAQILAGVDAATAGGAGETKP